MRIKSFFLTCVLLTCLTIAAQAQDEFHYFTSPVNPPNAIADSLPKSNLLKVNLTSLFVKNYSFQFERVLSKRFSAAISYRFMPSSTLPFKNTFLRLAGEEGDKDLEDVLNKFELSNTAITPEIRFYVGKKGYGRGFYLAPFYRHAAFKTNNLEVDFQSSFNVERSITMSGKINSNTGGLLLGSQWSLSKNISLDWWILGPHFGSGKGSFTGTSSQPLTQEEQNRLRQELEDIDIPLVDKTVVVNANGASVNFDGPFGGVRSGISIGFKF